MIKSTPFDDERKSKILSTGFPSLEEFIGNTFGSFIEIDYSYKNGAYTLAPHTILSNLVDPPAILNNIQFELISVESLNGNTLPFSSTLTSEFIDRLIKNQETYAELDAYLSDEQSIVLCGKGFAEIARTGSTPLKAMIHAVNDGYVDIGQLIFSDEHAIAFPLYYLGTSCLLLEFTRARTLRLAYHDGPQLHGHFRSKLNGKVRHYPVRQEFFAANVAESYVFTTETSDDIRNLATRLKQYVLEEIMPGLDDPFIVPSKLPDLLFSGETWDELQQATGIQRDLIEKRMLAKISTAVTVVQDQDPAEIIAIMIDAAKLVFAKNGKLDWNDKEPFIIFTLGWHNTALDMKYGLAHIGEITDCWEPGQSFSRLIHLIREIADPRCEGRITSDGARYSDLMRGPFRFALAPSAIQETSAHDFMQALGRIRNWLLRHARLTPAECEQMIAGIAA